MSNIYKNAIDIYKQDADHYRNKYIDALHTISLKDEEIKELKADIRHDARVCDDYDDDLIKECKELQAENDKLKDCSNVAYVEILNRSNDKLLAENTSLQDQLKDAVNDYEELVNSNGVK